MTVLIIDCGFNNLASLARAIEDQGARFVVSADPSAVPAASKLILPGVGSFASAMAALTASGWATAIRTACLDQGKPLLGICLGMQLLADKGTEGGVTEGLGLIPGKVVRLEPSGDWRLPHVGWNEVNPTRPSPLFEGLAAGNDFYFVHSYQFVPDRDEDVLARSPYAHSFVSAVGQSRIFGTQFHPEKSSRPGQQLLRNFLRL